MLIFSCHFPLGAVRPWVICLGTQIIYKYLGHHIYIMLSAWPFAERPVGFGSLFGQGDRTAKTSCHHEQDTCKTPITVLNVVEQVQRSQFVLVKAYSLSNVPPWYSKGLVLLSFGESAYGVSGVAGVNVATSVSSRLNVLNVLVEVILRG